jgi:hypothetical protein
MMGYIEAAVIIAFWFGLCAAFFVVRGIGGFVARIWRRW